MTFSFWKHLSTLCRLLLSAIFPLSTARLTSRAEPGGGKGFCCSSVGSLRMYHIAPICLFRAPSHVLIEFIPITIPACCWVVFAQPICLLFHPLSGVGCSGCAFDTFWTINTCTRQNLICFGRFWGLVRLFAKENTLARARRPLFGMRRVGCRCRAKLDFCPTWNAICAGLNNGGIMKFVKFI